MLARALTSPTPQDLGHRVVFYPFALVAAYVLSVFVEVQVSPYAMFRALAFVLVAAAVLTAVLWLILRDWHVAAAAASIALLVAVAWHSPILLVSALVLLVMIGILIGRVTGKGIPWAKLTYALNVLGVVLLIAVAIKAVSSGTLGQFVTDLGQGGPLPAPAAAPRADGPPDLYLILFDAYPRADTLTRVFGYDNEPFLSSLEERGFDVARNSHSNYAATKLTLASMLNMRLLHEVDELRPIIEEAQPELATVRNVTNDAAALKFLRDQGYEVIAYAPGYEETALRRADVFVDGGQLNEFEMILMRPTVLADLLSLAAPDFVGDQQRGRVADGLQFIRDVVGTPAERPRFGLIHIPSPHAPILYGRGGEPRRVDLQKPHDYDSGGQTPAEQVAQYRDQLDYLNEQVLGALDAVLGRPGVDPIVIIWSDHGSLIDLDTDPELRLSERVSNLFAARTPGHENLFDDSHTLVNTLPTLFNSYFGTALPTSPDRLFVSQQPLLFDWVEITPGVGLTR